jgi:hypothetical protein
MIATRKQWDDDRVKGAIHTVVAALGRFPSNSDLAEIGRGDLANQIRRRGGVLHWAERLGMQRQASDSDTGWRGEEAAATYLTEAGFKVTCRSGVKCPYDLLIDDCLRIDVKSARLACYHRCQGWFYRIGKYVQADVILLWQLDTGDFYALPWFVCPASSVTIAPTGGKYRAFRNNVTLIREMAAMRQKETVTYLDSLLRQTSLS